mgnify:CR=1 FL=1
MLITTYFIGGIASDERLFKHQITAIENAVYLPFPRPDKNDTMETYVLKFIPMIDFTQPFNIVANSMGGIMTMELLKHITPQKVILISSIKNRKEMPFILKQLKYTHAHKLLPGRGFIGSIQFGSLFKKEILKIPGMRQMAISMAKNNEPSFLYWCVNAIVKWNGKPNYHNNIIHIHGTNDEMFPYRRISNAIPVQGGTHVMMLTQHEVITRLLIENLK